jgi:hypothetical protein
MGCARNEFEWLALSRIPAIGMPLSLTPEVAKVDAMSWTNSAKRCANMSPAPFAFSVKITTLADAVSLLITSESKSRQFFTDLLTSSMPDIAAVSSREMAGNCRKGSLSHSELPLDRPVSRCLNVNL